MTNKILFVSCFIKIYTTPFNERTDEWRIQHFKQLLNTGAKIYLFISPEYEPIFENLRHIYSDNFTYHVIIDIPLLKGVDVPLSLPQTRNQVKDTYEYIALMNSKLHFIQLAINLTNGVATHYAWIDFNIAYIFREPEITLSFLRILLTAKISDVPFLYIPGCWDILPDNTPLITDNVHWRFCGGFFIGDKETILDFHRATNHHIKPQFLDKELITWETNYWAFLESNKIWSPTHWIRVRDHDDTMITKFPTELYLTPLTKISRIFDQKILPHVPQNFHLSSISHCVMSGQSILICRMINYHLSTDGRQYIYSDDDDGVIKNLNILVNLTDNTSKILTIDVAQLAHYGCFSYGLEDIRIYPDMTFSANSVSFTGGKVPQIVHGVINKQKGSVTDLMHIKSPRGENECEKNWIFITQPNGHKYVIYRWNPFEIGILKPSDNSIDIILSINLTPEYIFRNLRGSTIFIDYSIYRPNCHYNGDWLIGLTHYSIDQPNDAPIVRKYYHCLVLLNPTTLIPYCMTSPFIFGRDHGIEFCIGMEYKIDNGMFKFWVSIMDDAPKEFYIHESELEFNILIGGTKNARISA